jgi:hypothetical protein
LKRLQLIQILRINAPDAAASGDVAAKARGVNRFCWRKNGFGGANGAFGPRKTRIRRR